MFPPSFDYVRATSIEDALAHLARHEGDARLLAGGHSLIPALKRRRVEPGVVIDVGDIDELAGIEVADGTVRVGAAVTYADLLDDDRVRRRCRVLAEATRQVGDIQIRNRGTVGGNLAEAHPAADLPAAVLVADATLLVRGPDGERRVPADEFFLGDRETALAADEILTTVECPVANHVATANDGQDGPSGEAESGGEAGPGRRDATRVGGAYAKKTHPTTGYAMVGVAARVAVSGDSIARARVAANGVLDRPARLPAVETRLEGSPVTDDAIGAAVARAGERLDEVALRSDVQASGEFRVQLLGEYAARAVDTAIDRAEMAPGVGDDG